MPMRIYLGPREFVDLLRFAYGLDGKHLSGGMQNHRRKIREQIELRLAGLTWWERTGPLPEDIRYIELDDGLLRFVRKCLASKRTGGWQAAIFNIFAGSSELQRHIRASP